MKIEQFQIKLGKQTFTFRKLSAMAIMKRIGIPISDTTEIDMQEISKFAPNILETICTKPAELDKLNFAQIAQLMGNEKFTEFLLATLGSDEDISKKA